MRCCPPDNVLYGENTEELQGHLESCASCREDLKQMEHYVEAPLFSAKTFSNERRVPEPGELWSLKQELGGWGPKKRYYAPPLVVITEVNKDSVIVLQSCGDKALAASDDIPFGNDLQGFIQPWNQYSLRLEDLDSCYGAVAETAMQNVAVPREQQAIEPGSLLWFFRQMEVETGYFFSSRAVARLFAEHESVMISCETESIDPKALHEYLTTLGLVFQQSLPADYSVQDLLFHARPVDDTLPLAAADSAAVTDFALCLTMHNGKPEKVQPAGIHFTHWNLDSGFLHIVGKLPESMPASTQIFIRLQVEDTVFDPVPGEFGIENDLFWALFQVDNTDVEKGECLVRIIHNH
ncbi:MAG: hypothetical protein U9R57_12375 [Thermodesulfobacteriota bacterium]|nr:hypothetical protein [Thermodesulfobacteriota bacterium]